MIAAGVLWYAWPQLGPWPLILGLAPWAARLVLTGRLFQRSLFDLPLALFVLTAGVAVWAAYDRQVAWSRFWPIVGGVLLFYALANAQALPRVRVWLLVLLGAGMALHFLATREWESSKIGIAALSRIGQVLQAALPSIPGPELNRNEVGGILAMLAPFAGWTAVQSWQEIRDCGQARTLAQWLTLVLAWVLLALVLFGLLMTASRGAWIALGGALLLALAWIVAGRSGRRSARRRTAVFVGLSLFTFVAVLVLIVIVSSEVAFIPRALLNTDTWFSRLGFYRNSLTLVHDYPFIGAGLGGFQMLYSTYAILVHVGFISHSHNLLLDVAIEQGLPGVLALAWMWFLFAGVMWHTLLRPAAAQDRPAGSPPLLGIAALSLATILIHGLVDNALYTREGAFLLFVPLAFAIPISPEQNTAMKRWRVLSLAICLGLPLALLLARPRQTLSLAASNLGAVHQSQAELSVYSWPEWPIQDAVRRQVDLSQPIAEFDEALAWDPQNSTANRRLGMIELSSGQYEDALRHLQAAYAVESTSVTTRLLLGEALIVNGYVGEGQALWAGVNKAQHQLELRVFWYEYIGDEERAARLRQATRGQ